jgi:hypothetical protein
MRGFGAAGIAGKKFAMNRIGASSNNSRYGVRRER